MFRIAFPISILLSFVVVFPIENVSSQIENKLFFASIRNRFNDFMGCATIISPRLAITAATVVEGYLKKFRLRLEVCIFDYSFS